MLDLGAAGAVADQSAGGDELAPLIRGRDGVAGGQGHDLLAQDLEQGGGAKEAGIGLAVNHGRESCINLGLVRRIKNEDVLPDRLGRSLDLLNLERSGRSAWVDDNRD